jgi:MHS family proline/betaine transporter-like MFS transporter
MSRDRKSVPRPPAVRHQVMAGYIGNVVEWYDFALYGYLAGVIAPVFFPRDAPTAGLIATYGIFAAGFVMRPLGAALFGWFGDLYGRARTMQISVAMMALPTLLLGLLPTYQQAGILAPVLLVAVRLLQGISVGGEFSSSVTYLVETAPQGRRGITGSWANVGSMTGTLLGVGAATLATNLLDSEALLDWGWRLPFLGGAILGSIAIRIRWSLHESARFRNHHHQREETSPLLEAFTTNRRETMLALAFAAGYGTCYYLAFVYLPEWLDGLGLMSRSQALLWNTAMTMVVIPAMPLTATVGDQWLGRRTWIAIAILVLVVVTYPLYHWMITSQGSISAIAATHAITFLLLSVPLGSGPALFVEMFPEKDRLSGYSVAFNVGLGVFGGMTPMISSSLLAATGYPAIPAFHMIAAAVVALVALLLIPDRSRMPLR